MPDSDEAFRCAECSRVYKTRTSLTRHSRNHAPGAAKQYTCETCGVVFARRDILNRHVINGHCGRETKDGKAAGRCHTACEGCRRSRVRCDGGEPCKSCVERKKECKYPKSTGRISEKLTRAGRLDSNASASCEASSPLIVKHEIPYLSTSPSGDVKKLNKINIESATPTAEEHTATTSQAMGGEFQYSQQQYIDLHNSTYASSSPITHQPHFSYTNGNNGPANAIYQASQLSTEWPPHVDMQADNFKGLSEFAQNSKPHPQNGYFNDGLRLLGNNNVARPQLNGHDSVTSEPNGVYNIDTNPVDNMSAKKSVHNAALSQRIKNDAKTGTPMNSTSSAYSTTPGEAATNEKPASTTPEVHHVSWPWLHERKFFGPKSKVKGNARTKSPLAPTLERQASTPESLGSPSEMDAGYREIITPLATIVENLVAYAANTALNPDPLPQRRRYWETTSIQLHDIYHAHGCRSTEDPKGVLYRFAESCWKNFNVIWPTFGSDQTNHDSYHPVVFLVVTSIGAMCGLPMQRQYGALMHVRLRRLLCASLYDLEGPEDDEMIWLVQARLQTQVASLYLGQHQGFSYSQHLAAITIAQMRRMNVLREAIPDITRHLWSPPATEYSRWQHAETQRRLAFGILRTDAYNSILLSTKPLVTSEELHLTLPRPNRIWMNEDRLGLEDLVRAQRSADDAILPMPLSDIVRVFLDRDEPKPDLTPIGYELALFGLQEWVWRFSHDTELYVRLTGRCLDGTKIDVPRILPPREMKEVHSDYSRLVHALESWNQGLHRAMARGEFADDRKTLVCCQLLYRLAKLRMCTPLEDLHHVSYRAADTRTIDANIFRMVHGWLLSPFAADGARQAWDIKLLIEEELLRPAGERANLNFLAFCSLHHSAVVLWTFAGAGHARAATDIFSPPYKDVEAFVKDCANMFTQLSPLGGQSFEAAARRLNDHRFPQFLPQYHDAVT